MTVIREVHPLKPDGNLQVVDESNYSDTLKVSEIFSSVLIVLEGLLLFRLAFKLFGANPTNDFVEFIYRLSQPLLAPFRGIFSDRVEGGLVFESATFIAIVVYALIAQVLISLFFVTAERRAAHRRSPDTIY